MKPIELWGGAECTVNRVNDRFGDQICATGHDIRIEDIDLLADLGFAAIRFPILWERVSPDDPHKRDWRWSDERVDRLRALGVRPIAGLVHHGSGPAYTSLLDEGFAPGLADHARAVAERYPWIAEWTPVNEPLTTARFAALYGHWYPHARDERAFWFALVNQVDAVRLAMRAIRRVNPAALLVQTDDLGRSYATAAVADQAAFDNVRRWMGWDLLFGRVVPGHDFWRRLCEHGLEDRLRAIADDPCPPDIVGINHYLTSDRFLDHRVESYPPETHGGNFAARYADVAAVRALDPPPPGLSGAIREAWERYHTPVALTEIHNGCTREEQLRWLHEGWQAALEARAEGMEVRAVTPWAVFGNQGWNTLLTAEGTYEAGVYDVSGGSPRPTALATLIRDLPGGAASHPGLQGRPWWRRPVRFHHPEVPRPAPIAEHRLAAELGPGGGAAGAPILIAGATGTLGGALAAACRHRDLAHHLTDRGDLDLLDPDSIAAALDRIRPWAVINAAGWVRVDDAEGENEAQACLAVNGHAAVALAAACEARGIPSLGYSSDLVFAGEREGPYLEDDRPDPCNVYGQSKAIMEAGVAALGERHLVVRTAAFFSPFDPHNFAVHCVGALARGEQFRAAADQVVTPTYVPDLCEASLDLLLDGAGGLWHLSNGEALSWADFARRLAESCGLDRALVVDAPGAELGWRARRPRACGLASSRGGLMPPLSHAIARFAAHMAPRLAPPVAADAPI